MKKLLTILFATVLVCSILFGCAKKTEVADEQIETVENRVTFNIGSEPTTLDPGLSRGVDNNMVIRHLYEGLFEEHYGEFVLASAESFEQSADGKVYTFKIRDNVWSDGVPVTAYDFEFAWNRVLDPAVASPSSDAFGNAAIENFRAIDDKTLEVTLKADNPIFIQMLSTPTFLPLREDKIDYLTGAWALDADRVVTNGPFTMIDYLPGNRVIMQKNEKFYNAENVSIDEIVALMIVDQTTALTAYESGEIDAITGIPPAEIPRIINEDSNYITAPQHAANYYAFNIHREPFDDIRVREAFSYAIDRNAIVRDVQKGGQIPAHSLVPDLVLDEKGNPFNSRTNHGIPYDLSKVAEAQRLLAEAGYPNGEGFPDVELLYNTSESNKAHAEALQQMWKDNLGVEIALVNMESSVFHQTRVAHDFDITRGGLSGAYSDPLAQLGVYQTDNVLNYADWSSDEYDALIEQARVQNGAERYETFHKADKILSETYIYMPISHSAFNAVINKDKIKDYQIVSGGTIIDYSYATIIGAE